MPGNAQPPSPFFWNLNPWEHGLGMTWGNIECNMLDPFVGTNNPDYPL